ncbi:NAD-dependent epimerase/dehydratase family protein [Marmoricola sp. URHB0036]|uniref:NAD-dependent epimerase/dehydratase family protein n=1 Tax=Marmoricola sp. URHB0036 TaxID=1298863 RepID=UPI00041EE5EA|nr:NAD-dependent epimerase/dehydratase family protein [Marmoricola sp. URHB0036]
MDVDPGPDPHPDQARTAWVIGGGGLLGSAVCRRLRALGREPRTTIVPWEDRDNAVTALLAAVEGLAGALEVYWCAGAGVVATSEEDLAVEMAILEQFLERWQPDGRHRHGFFLASSAGGVYAGARGGPFTEHTEPAPLSPYGHAKLRTEVIATEFAQRTGTALLVGRLANLYGPGQDLSKPQGLVSALCRAQLSRQPISVYVSLDTRRDYLFVDDAAAMVVAATGQVTDHGVRALKVIASERSTTVGAVLGDLHRITRRRPPIVLGTSPQSGFQVRDLRLRSVAWPHTSALARTPLSAGIAATLRSTGSQIVPVLPRWPT